LNCLSRDSSSSPARKFDRTFLVTACSFFADILALYRTSICIASHCPPSYTLIVAAFYLCRSPPYPTDNVASNDGTTGSHELLTTSPRPDLYALLSASCTLSAIKHSLRRCSHPLSSSSYVRCIVSSTPSQASAMPHPTCFISLSGFGRPILLSLVVHFVRVVGPSSSLLSNLSFVATPSGIGGRPFVSFCTTHFFVILLHTIGLYMQSRL